jgi:hypothetical protein
MNSIERWACAQYSGEPAPRLRATSSRSCNAALTTART